MGVKTKDLNISMDTQTKMESKEEHVLELFFNSSKYWHFDNLLKKANISRSQLAQWLKKFEKWERYTCVCYTLDEFIEVINLIYS